MMKNVYLPILLTIILSVVLSTYDMKASLNYNIQSRIEKLESRVNQAGNTTKARNIKVKLDRIESKVNSTNISYQDERQWEDFRDDIQKELSELEKDAENL